METEVFDPAEFLSTETAQIEYVNAALETGDADYVARSIQTVARARGLAGLMTDRPALDPASVLASMQALGLRLVANKAA